MHDVTPRTTRSLTGEGWSSRQIAQAVQAGSLRRVGHGLYVAPDEVTPADAHRNRARAILLRHGTSPVLSHETAAIFHGIPVLHPDPDVVHLTVDSGQHGRRRPGFRIHRSSLGADEVVMIDGVAVTSMARTAIDLVRTTPYIWGVIALDHVLHAGVDRVLIGEFIEAHPAWRGMPVLRRALRFADGRAESPAESASRVTMARAGLPAPELQVEVVGPNGWAATCDFGWEEPGVVGEVDGRVKYGELLRPGQTAQDIVMLDKAREERIRQAGLWPTRWGWAEAFDPAAMRARILVAFARPDQRRRGG